MPALTILLRLFLPFRKIKQKVIEDEKQRILERYKTVFEEYDRGFQLREIEFKKRTAEHQKEIEEKKNDIESALDRLNDKKASLERANEELKTQIRLIEAKASPDNVWVESFSCGFSKAWDVMNPFIVQSVEQMKKYIERKSIDETLNNLESVIAKRIELSGNHALKSVNRILSKLDQFEKKLQGCPESDRIKFESYISALRWVLHDDELQKNE